MVFPQQAIHSFSGGQRFSRRAAVTFFGDIAPPVAWRWIDFQNSSEHTSSRRWPAFVPTVKKENFESPIFVCGVPGVQAPFHQCTRDLLCPGTPEEVGDLIPEFSLSKNIRVYRTQVCLWLSLQNMWLLLQRKRLILQHVQQMFSMLTRGCYRTCISHKGSAMIQTLIGGTCVFIVNFFLKSIRFPLTVQRKVAAQIHKPSIFCSEFCEYFLCNYIIHNISKQLSVDVETPLQALSHISMAAAIFLTGPNEEDESCHHTM